jgi:hypothetical protein
MIEYRALATLRTAINKLLIDYEKSEEYSGNLKNLLSLVNGGVTVPESGEKKLTV